MKLVDIALNWTDDMFRGVYHGKKYHHDDSGDVVKRAVEAGLEKFIITGTSLEESRRAVKLAAEENKNHPRRFFATVGTHPTRCDEFEKTDANKYYEELLKLAKEGLNVVAIGECGLDYDRLHFCAKETQMKYFERQFHLAEETKLPMFLHNRNTGGDFVRMIRQNRHKFSTGVVHSYDGSIEEMRELIAMDLYIGINGCSMKTEQNIEMVREIPVDRLMIETDAPWCDVRPSHASYKLIPDNGWKPEPSVKKDKFAEGKMIKGRNEPCCARQIIEIIANIKQLDAEELAKQVYDNTEQVFFRE